MAGVRTQPRPLWRLPIAALLCASALATGTAHAAESSWSLRWRAPTACPDERAVRETVAAWLAQSGEPTAADGIDVDAAVTRVADGFALDLLLITPSGQARERLVAERCDTLAGVVALKVALAADPGAWFPANAAESAPPVRWGLRLAGGIAWDLLPGPAPSLALMGTLRFDRIEFELGGGYAFRAPVRYPDQRSVGADVDLLYASARICVLPELGSVEFPICGGADLGALRGVGFGVATTFESVQLYSALVIAPGLRWPLGGSWFAWFSCEGLVALQRPAFHVRNLERLWVSETIAARTQLGVELRFD